MLKALRDWGELYYEERLYDKIEADKVIIIELDKDGKYKNLLIEEFSKEKLSKYFYRKSKGSNPPTETPTLRLNTEDPKKSIENLIKANERLRKFNNKIPKLFNSEQDGKNQGIENLASEIEKILPKKGDKKDNTKEESYLLTIKVDGKYVGELDYYREALKDNLLFDYKQEAICSVCGENKKVSDKIPFYFLTFDKPGYVVGGFNKELAYRNCPVCSDCYEKMRIGREKIEEFKFKFAGIDYLVVPETVDKNTLSNLRELFEYIKKKEFKLGDNEIEEIKARFKDLLGEKKDLSEILSEIISGSEKDKEHKGELDILSMLSRLKDFMWFHFLFLKKENSREVIRLYISEVFPSRIQKLFEVKIYIENLLKKNLDYLVIKNFFDSNSFYDVVRATFEGKPISKEFILSSIMEYIRKGFFDWSSKGIDHSKLTEAFGVYLFIRITTGGLEMEQSPTPKPNSLEEFFEYVRCLPSVKEDWRYALVLLGFLTAYLVKNQYASRGTGPFLKRLKNLKMDWEDAKGLLPQLAQKLQEYKIYERKPVRKVFGEISEAFSKSSTPKASLSEINFYFVCGMGLYEKYGDLIKGGKEDEQGD